ncbi:MAG: Na+:solute symporter, partial [Verrucomicrobiota bacterium]
AYLFGVMYLVTPLFWMLPPLLFRGQFEGVNKEEAYILAAQSVLPPGVLGLMFAAMFSATASMVSSQLNVFAGVLTNDFYRSFVNPRASERLLVRTGRVFTVVLGALLVMTAILVPKLGGAEKLIISINSLLVVPLFAPTLWGLFSQKIGIRDMIIVAMTSFVIGLGLRFGLATNPLIQEGSSLSPLASYLAENTKNVEVVVGVLLPILMLIGFEWKKKGIDPGATRVEDHCAKAKAKSVEVATSVAFDPFAARMVLYSLWVIGGWMLMLGVMEEHGRTVLLSFGGALIAVGGGIQVFVRKMISRSSQTEEGTR